MKPDESTVQNQQQMDFISGENKSESGAGAQSAEPTGSLQESLQAAQAESKKNYDLYLRAVAEMENLRKRNQREREEYIKFASLPLIKPLLTVIDDLDRALALASPEQDYSGLHKGIEMVCQRLKEIVVSAGVEPVEALGQDFDPQYHQPLAVEASAEHPENTVIEELQKGYVMHGRVIRPSLVKVSG